MSGFEHINRGGTRAFGEWDENKHKRDKGKFAPKEGAGASEEEAKPWSDAADSFVEEIKGLDTEKGLLLSGTNGRVLSQGDGDDKSVSKGIEHLGNDAALLLRGAVSIHNHPHKGTADDELGLAFSLQDVLEAQRWGFHETQVVSGNTVYTLTAGGRGGTLWPNRKALKEQWSTSLALAKKKVQPLLDSGEIDEKKAMSLVAIDTWSDVAEKAGLKFKHRPITPKGSE